MAAPAKHGKDAATHHAAHRIGYGRFRVTLPRSRLLRIGLGMALIVGGCLGFLPILGFWMLPLGLGVLSIDIPPVRRFRRRARVWWGRSAWPARLSRAMKAIFRKPK